MRRCVSLLLFFPSILVAGLLRPAGAYAQSQLTVTVTDPRGAAVAGARVEAMCRDSATGKFAALAFTDAEGTARLAQPSDRSCASQQIRVYAAGFAPAEQTATSGDTAVRLKVVAAAETVNVTAERTPLPEAESGSMVSALDGAQIQNLNAVSAADLLRLMPGAVVNTAGQRGGLASLFVRGGESRYNKVLIDSVPVDDPGGTFDFGAAPTAEAERVEMVRGADSALYGSDAMTSVVQVFSRTGTTATPELRFGADGGTFQTAHGYASLAGARGRFDYNGFADQFNTLGEGANDLYSNALQGANAGVKLGQRVMFRFRTRHSNVRAGVPGEWNFEGRPLLPPDMDGRTRQNNFLASGELAIAASAHWQHRVTLYEYNHRRLDEDTVQEPGRSTPAFGNFDFPFASFAHDNRAGATTESEYAPKSWSRTIFGYEFEDENGFVGDFIAGVNTHGLRRNHAIYGEQIFTWDRWSVIVGGRFLHNESFGNRAVPRLAAAYQLKRGGSRLSGTRVHAGFAEGIKEPRFEESFGEGGFGILPNPNLRAEQNRSVEAGVEQSFAEGRYSAAATYFHNAFRDMIEFNFDATTFLGQYVNVNRAFAEGAELEFHARLNSRWRVDSSYTYTDSKILVAPFSTDPLQNAGAPLLRRPKHSGTMLVNYAGRRMGGEVGGSFVGRRTDSDFLGLTPPITHAPGYALVNAGGWYALNHRVTAYVNLENLLDRQYEEVVGYPGLKANFRAGVRFRLGGE